MTPHRRRELETLAQTTGQATLKADELLALLRDRDSLETLVRDRYTLDRVEARWSRRAESVLDRL